VVELDVRTGRGAAVGVVELDVRTGRGRALREGIRERQADRWYDDIIRIFLVVEIKNSF
jgi:hypothetical protein